MLTNSEFNTWDSSRLAEESEDELTLAEAEHTSNTQVVI